MYLKFTENSSVNFEIIKEEEKKEEKKEENKKISAGAIVGIIFGCIAVLAILGTMFYFMRKRNMQSTPMQSLDKNNNTLGVNGYTSSSNINN